MARTQNIAVALAVGIPLAVIASGPTQAQGLTPAEFSCPAPGTVMETSTGAKYSFGERDGLVCKFVNIKGEDKGTYGAIASAGSNFHKDRVAEIAKLWPLQAGKSISYTPSSGSTIVEIKVGAPAKVTTRAGEFETFPITYVQSGQKRGQMVTTWTYYWAPKLGYSVKYDFAYDAIVARASNQTYANQPWEAVKITSP